MTRTNTSVGLRSQPGWSALGSAIYAVGLIFCTYSLHATENLHSTGAFVPFAFAAFVSGGALLLPLRLGRRSSAQTLSWRTVLRQHWRYGRWSTGNAPIAWFSKNAYYALTPIWLGLQGVAYLRALLNLAMPLLHSNAALSVFLLPGLARAASRRDVAETRRIMKITFVFLLLCACAFAAFLLTFREPLLGLLYGDKYSDFSFIAVFLVALLPFGTSVTSVLGSALSAAERPQSAFLSHLAAALATIAVGIPLTAVYGIPGALGGLLIATVVDGVMKPRFWFASPTRRSGKRIDP